MILGNWAHAGTEGTLKVERKLCERDDVANFSLNTVRSFEQYSSLGRIVAHGKRNKVRIASAERPRRHDQRRFCPRLAVVTTHANRQVFSTRRRRGIREIDTPPDSNDGRFAYRRNESRIEANRTPRLSAVVAHRRGAALARHIQMSRSHVEKKRTVGEFDDLGFVDVG